VSWRIQGTHGGESLAGAVHGPRHFGGLHGERAGYHLPGFPNRRWARVSPPHRENAPTVAWYRTTVRLAARSGALTPGPAGCRCGQDWDISVEVTDRVCGCDR
jgi:beta-galactosidase GanA